MQLRGKLRNYKEKTVEINRRCAFRPDRIVMTDEVLWVHRPTRFENIEWTASFLPGCVQSPVRLIKDVRQASFYPVGSGGEKLPQGIAFPCTAENFLKNGWKVSLRTAEASFDLGRSNLYLYEKPWQQDWDQVSGFKYHLGDPAAEKPAQDKPVKLKHEIVFSKATLDEMPPVITIRSPGSSARWMDEKGEKPKYAVGDIVPLSASAVNSDGTAVPDTDISWDIRIEAWWKRRPTVLRSAAGSYTVPQAANGEEKTIAGKRPLLAVIKVTARGKNGTEATEHMAMLVGLPEKK